jgi:NTE family protein
MEGWRRHNRIGRRTLLNADHLMASSAIPSLFPTTKIEHEYFGDGALRQLSPISPALHLGADRVFVIGVSGNRERREQSKPILTRHSPSMAQIIGHMFNSAFVDSLEGDIENLERLNRLVALIPEASRKEHGIKVRPIESLVVSPSEQLDKIAGRNIRYLPRSLRVFLRNTGATASGGGATAASYLLFAKPFIDDLIALGHKDTLWERNAIEAFFAATSKTR